MKNKLHKCKICKGEYIKHNSLQIVCSPKCAIEYARKQEEKNREKHHKELKKKVRNNDRSYWNRKAQKEFNKYIRFRDKHLNCISCSKPFNAKYDAGHYRSVGAHPELRFSELNNNGQCVRCNQHLSGNLINYRIGLSKRISKNDLEWLEGPHEPKRYTVENLRTIAKWYARKNKRIERDET